MKSNLNLWKDALFFYIFYTRCFLFVSIFRAAFFLNSVFSSCIIQNLAFVFENLYKFYPAVENSRIFSNRYWKIHCLSLFVWYSFRRWKVDILHIDSCEMKTLTLNFNEDSEFLSRHVLTFCFSFLQRFNKFLMQQHLRGKLVSAYVKQFIR